MLSGVVWAIFQSLPHTSARLALHRKDGQGTDRSRPFTIYQSCCHGRTSGSRLAGLSLGRKLARHRTCRGRYRAHPCRCAHGNITTHALQCFYDSGVCHRCLVCCQLSASVTFIGLFCAFIGAVRQCPNRPWQSHLPSRMYKPSILEIRSRSRYCEAAAHNALFVHLDLVCNVSLQRPFKPTYKVIAWCRLC